MPDLILAAIFALVGFLQGIAWEHHRREREECERTERLWQEVQRQIIDDAVQQQRAYHAAEARARMLPEKQRRATFAARN